jgi:NTP pyrophosphatase (non-canonical NTP hydrolase)
MVTTQASNPLYTEITSLRKLLQEERVEHAQAIQEYRDTQNTIMREHEDTVAQVHRLHAALADCVGVEKADLVKKGPRKGARGA